MYCRDFICWFFTDIGKNMSQGKYSPNLPKKDRYDFNCYGKIPSPWNKDTPKDVVYDSKIHFGGYDDEGYDEYGYSCFDENSEYVGLGSGIDRNGFTELQYLIMRQEDFIGGFK